MTGLVRGALPNADEIVLSMERMNAVEEVDASTGVAIAQAGTPLQKLQERVEQDGLMFHSTSAHAAVAPSAAISRPMPAATASSATA